MEVVAGAEETTLEDEGRLVWTRTVDGREVTIGDAATEPLFELDFDEVPPRLTWTTRRPGLARDVRAPTSAGEACALAHAAASTFDAVAVWYGRSKDRVRTTLAITSFRLSSDEPAAVRASKVERFVAGELAQKGDAVVNTIARHGSAGAPVAAGIVAEVAYATAALHRYYVPELPLARRLDDLLEKLRAWAMRARLPTDEAMRVGAEMQAEARAWRAS